MTIPELLLVAAEIVWIASFVGLSVKLVRARRPEEHEEAYQMMTAVIIAGVIMFVAPSAIQWLTGFQKYGDRYCSEDPSNSGVNRDKVCLPEDMSGIFDKIINGLRALGGVVLVIGLIWSGIKLLAVPREPSSSGGGSKAAASPPGMLVPA